MRKVYLLMTFVVFALIVACNPSSPEENSVGTSAPQNVDPAATAPDLFTAPAPTTVPDDYPPPPTPSNSGLPEGYPTPPEIPTLPPKYPVEDESRVWITRPLGMQCTEASTYVYPTLNDAVRSLEAVNIEVFGAEVVGLMVCEACDCPTSEHYRVQIGVEHLATATQMGWSAEIGG